MYILRQFTVIISYIFLFINLLELTDYFWIWKLCKNSEFPIVFHVP